MSFEPLYILHCAAFLGIKISFFFSIYIFSPDTPRLNFSCSHFKSARQTFLWWLFTVYPQLIRPLDPIRPARRDSTTHIHICIPPAHPLFAREL